MFCRHRQAPSFVTQQLISHETPMHPSHTTPKLRQCTWNILPNLLCPCPCHSAQPIACTVGERGAPSKLQLPVGRRLSGHKTWDAVPRHSQKLSRAETEYYDAVSVHDAEHEQQQANSGSTEELDAVASQLQQQLQQRVSGGVPGRSGAEQRLANSAGRALWVPETPLLFARKGVAAGM